MATTSSTHKLDIAKEIVIAALAAYKGSPEPAVIAELTEAAAKAVNNMEKIIEEQKS
jgi:hypothetical protein